MALPTVNPVITMRLGDTFSWAGVVTLPGSGTWSAECSLRGTTAKVTPVEPDFLIPATLTLIGANALNAAMNDYTLLLAANGSATAGWATLNSLNATATLMAAVKFYDNAVPPNQMTTQPISVIVSYNLVPLA